MPAADARRVRAAPRRCEQAEQAEHNLLAAPRRCEQAEHNLLAAPRHAPAPCRAAASHTAPRLAARLAAPHDVRVSH
jgi:hypothetical protein